MKETPQNPKSSTAEGTAGGSATSVAAVPGAVIPFRLKTILVPTDFSGCSMKALQYAIPFASMTGASVVLLNVVQVHLTPGDFYPAEPLIEDPVPQEFAKKQMENMVASLNCLVPIKTLVRLGIPTDVIVDEAREQDVDLIVLSTHGHTGLRHILMGGTAEHVVRRAPCPVLVVRP